jgi:hypothetical protein
MGEGPGAFRPAKRRKTTGKATKFLRKGKEKEEKEKMRMRKEKNTREKQL